MCVCVCVSANVLTFIKCYWIMNSVYSKYQKVLIGLKPGRIRYLPLSMAFAFVAIGGADGFYSVGSASVDFCRKSRLCLFLILFHTWYFPSIVGFPLRYISRREKITSEMKGTNALWCYFNAIRSVNKTPTTQVSHLNDTRDYEKLGVHQAYACFGIEQNHPCLLCMLGMTQQKRHKLHHCGLDSMLAHSWLTASKLTRVMHALKILWHDFFHCLL